MASNSNSECFTLLLELNLQSIPTDVVERCWKGEQLETDQDHVESVTGTVSLKFMKSFQKALQKLMKSSSDFWTYISERQLSFKSLIIWLFTIVEKRNECSFLAGACYLNLLGLPGNGGFPIYHPFAFRGTLNLLKSWKDAQMKEFLVSTSKEKLAKRTKRKNEGSKKKGKAKKSKKTSKSRDEDEPQSESHSEEDNDMNEENMQDIQDDKDSNDQNVLKVDYEYFMSLMNSLYVFFKDTGLDKYSSDYTDILDIIIDLTRFPYAIVFPKMEEGSTICYSILNHILKYYNKDSVAIIYTNVFKGLLSNLLMNYSQNSGSSIPKHLNTIRIQAVDFICGLINLEDEVCLENVHILLQQLCIRVTEKAEYRSYTCDSVLDILIPFPLLERARFIKFLVRLSKNVKPSSRLLAVEISSYLLSNINKLVVDKDNNLMEGSICAPLLEILIKRSSDKIGTVRAKALSCLSTIFELVETNEILRNEIKSSFQRSNMEGGFNIDKIELLSLLRKRIVDDKSGVRKSALQVYQIFGCLEDNLIQEIDICLIVERCLDNAVSIRKEAMNCICTLVSRYPTDKSICIAWCHSILPLIMDPESTVQNKCLDYFDTIIFKDLLNNKENSMCWNILQYIQSESNKYLEKLFLLLSREKKLTKSLVKCIEECITNRELSKSCWLLLNYIAPYSFNYIDHEVVVDKWEDIKYSTKEEDVTQQQQILSVLESISVNISSKVSKKLIEELFERLKRFDASCPLIQSMIRALVRLTSNSTSYLQEWSEELLSICDQQLAFYLLPQNSMLSSTSSSILGNISSDSIIRYLFTIGELSQISSCTIPSRVVTLIQALTSSSNMLSSNDNSTTIDNISINNTILNSYSSTSTSSINNSGVRAYAFITLGKLCLEDQQLAKKCIPALARDLQSSDSPVVRNNIIVILCDLCIKYTAIVDKFIPTIALSLRDSNDTVRRQTLMLLSRLLQEDFLKWKTTLFYRFILALVDDNTDVQQSARYCFVTLLKSKNPIMFFTHFMETVFYLNNSNAHSVYNQFPQSERERILFSLSGSENRKKRMEIYKLFLNNMSDEQKFQIAAKLCQEILATIVDGQLPYESCSEILYDSLVLLSSKDIKLTAKSSNTAQSTEEEEQEEAINAAKDKLLSKIVKKNVLENIVPIVIELKRYLEKRRSPMLKNVMEYLKEMLKDYKEEISDILVADKQLAKEIEYDMKQFAAQQKKVQTMTAAGTPDKLMSPRPMFSPKTSTPKELANFSVPRLRGSTPHSANKRSSLVVPSANPFLSPAPNQTKSKKKPFEEVDSNVKDHPIVLNSPVNESPSARKWGVSLQSVSVPLSFDEDDAEEESNKRATKKKKTTQKKAKTTKTRKN